MILQPVSSEELTNMMVVLCHSKVDRVKEIRTLKSAFEKLGWETKNAALVLDRLGVILKKAMGK